MQTLLKVPQISLYSGVFGGYQVEFTSKLRSLPCTEVWWVCFVLQSDVGYHLLRTI